MRTGIHFQSDQGRIRCESTCNVQSCDLHWNAILKFINTTKVQRRNFSTPIYEVRNWKWILISKSDMFRKKFDFFNECKWFRTTTVCVKEVMTYDKCMISGKCLRSRTSALRNCYFSENFRTFLMGKLIFCPLGLTRNCFEKLLLSWKYSMAWK